MLNELCLFPNLGSIYRLSTHSTGAQYLGTYLPTYLPSRLGDPLGRLLSARKAWEGSIMPFYIGT